MSGTDLISKAGLAHCEGHIHRRDLLTGLCTLAGMLAVSPASIESSHVRAKPVGLIDVHHYILPPGASEGMKKLMAGWSAPGAVAEMDSTGVATGIAYPGPILSGSDVEKGDKARVGTSSARKSGRIIRVVSACLHRCLFRMSKIALPRSISP